MHDFRDALVRDVMSSPVITIGPETPLQDVVTKMYRGDATCFVVDLGDPAEGYGILTQKDLLTAMTEEGLELADLTVADAMSHPMVSVPPTFNIRTCVLQMRMLGVRRAAVVDGTELVGLITFTDVFRYAVESAGTT